MTLLKYLKYSLLKLVIFPCHPTRPNLHGSGARSLPLTAHMIACAPRAPG